LKTSGEDTERRRDLKAKFTGKRVLGEIEEKDTCRV
jgi:hypothetical protein